MVESDTYRLEFDGTSGLLSTITLRPYQRQSLAFALALETSNDPSLAGRMLSLGHAQLVVEQATRHGDNEEVLFNVLTVLRNNVATGFLYDGVPGAIAGRDVIFEAGAVETGVSVLQQYSSAVTTDLQMINVAMAMLRTLSAPGTPS